MKHATSLLTGAKRAAGPRFVSAKRAAKRAAVTPRLVSAVRQAARGLVGPVLVLFGGACSAFTDFGNWEESQAGACWSGANAACVNASCCVQYELCVSGEADAGDVAACSAAAQGECPGSDAYVSALQTCLVIYCGAPPCGE